MYSDQFGLSELPFQLTPDARFFWESRTHKRALQYLGFGLAQGEGFVVITGEIGAGKTTLVEHLLGRVDLARTLRIRINTAQVAASDLLRLVAEQLGGGARGAEKGDLMTLIEERLGQEAAMGRRALLIVDEAQALPTDALEELGMLSNFSRGGRPLVQILLLGQPEFRDRLARAPELEQLRQRVIAAHHLAPMGADEVAPYLLHRLERVGWTGRPAFEPAAFDAFYRLSDGIPRRLNALAHRAMLAAAVDGQSVIDADLVAEVASENAWPQPEATAASILAAPTPNLPDSDRIQMLERRLAEQDAALRRVLALLVHWVEGAPHAEQRLHAVHNDAA